MDLQKLFDSRLHVKVLRFFHENQASIDTPRGIATWVAEERSRVKRVLEDLVDLNILVAHRSTSTTGYSYTRDPELITKIGKLLKQNEPA